MKKLLGILVLGLLWCNVGIAADAASLVGSKWKLKRGFEVRKITIKFLDNNLCKNSQTLMINRFKGHKQCSWSQDGRKVLIATANAANIWRGTLSSDFKTISGIVKYF